MQMRLTTLQNPSQPCSTISHVLYDINQYCGFGCQIHRTLRCFLMSYIHGRTMILESGIL